MSTLWRLSSSKFVLYALIVLSVFLALPAFASFSCEDLFVKSVPTTKIKWRNKSLEVLALKDNRWLRTSSLPPRFAKRLIVGFNDHHAFVSYNDVRVDAEGIPGLSVKATVRRMNGIEADVLAFIEMEPHQAQALMDRFTRLLAGDRERSLTCSTLSCSFVREGAPGLLPLGLYVTPSSLLTSLMDLSVRQPGRVTIAIVDEQSPQRLMNKQRMDVAARVMTMPLVPLLLFIR